MGCEVRPKPQAVSLAAKLEAAFQSEPVLVPEGKGIFDVVVNDQLVYSKHRTRRSSLRR